MSAPATDICFDAARVCLKRGITFALSFLPGRQTPLFSAMQSAPGRVEALSGSVSGFLVNTFEPGNIPWLVRNELSPEGVLNNSARSFVGIAPHVRPWEISTRREIYRERVGNLIARLAETGGKTVVSRAICRSEISVDWIAVARELFSRFPQTYRFIYYTPQTGAWLGASPETLLDYDAASSTVSTMALAGTRPYSAVSSAWDAKNRREHRFVTDYIVSVLSSCGLSPVVGPAENLRYGIVEHLCHRITAAGAAPEQVIPVLSALSPTPALAGYPLADALRQIAQVEDYPRLCYGGYVGNVGGGSLHTCVNLRSVHFSDNGFCIMVGGGITSDSDAVREWEETEAKSRILLQTIMNNLQ